ncbi:HIT family protein [Tundrisphaera sp. TA3]|uniref:HIT family protein n=1 Tax=Tundrisphaera sp. TA3 TaxID=3435775 RepID=UPI003EBCD238
MSHQDPDCLFCRIIAGQIPSAQILETDWAVAFLDIHPVNPGHVLLVPKVHHATLADLPEDAASAVAALMPGLVRAIIAATGADGLNVVVNNGHAAGQTVDHGHWHLIPRFHGDPVHWPWPHQSYSGDELGRMQGRIAEAFRARPS